MRERTWPILAAGFGTLVLLIVFLGFQTWQQAKRLYHESVSIEEAIQSRRHTLNKSQSKVYLSGILVRDFLLDLSNLTAGSYRQELLGIRSSIDQDLKKLGEHATPEESDLLQNLDRGLQDYWTSLEPLLEWTPERKTTLSGFFLRKQILPRRKAVLGLASRVEELHETQFKQEQEKLRRRQEEFLKQLARLMVGATALGLLVAGLGTYRVSRLERRTEAERKRTEQAEKELRRLSQQLVHTQEDERRSISRELHDEVGQLLTALRMELNWPEITTCFFTAISRNGLLRQAPTSAPKTLETSKAGTRPPIRRAS